MELFYSNRHKYARLVDALYVLEKLMTEHGYVLHQEPLTIEEACKLPISSPEIAAYLRAHTIHALLQSKVTSAEMTLGGLSRFYLRERFGTLEAVELGEFKEGYVVYMEMGDISAGTLRSHSQVTSSTLKDIQEIAPQDILVLLSQRVLCYTKDLAYAKRGALAQLERMEQTTLATLSKHRVPREQAARAILTAMLATSSPLYIVLYHKMGKRLSTWFPTPSTDKDEAIEEEYRKEMHGLAQTAFQNARVYLESL